MPTREFSEVQFGGADVPPRVRGAAVRTVAATAADAAECAQLLDMLGLTPAEGLPDTAPAASA